MTMTMTMTSLTMTMTSELEAGAITIEYRTEDGDRVMARLRPIDAAHLLQALFDTLKAYGDKMEGATDGGE